MPGSYMSIVGTCTVLTDDSPDTDKCSIQRSNCVTCLDGQCRACTTGYQLTVTGDCEAVSSEPYEDNCFLFENDMCEICETGFKMSVSGHCIFSSMENCDTFANSVCSECASGYTADDNGEC